MAQNCIGAHTSSSVWTKLGGCRDGPSGEARWAGSVANPDALLRDNAGPERPPRLESGVGVGAARAKRKDRQHPGEPSDWRRLTTTDFAWQSLRVMHTIVATGSPGPRLVHPLAVTFGRIDIPQRSELLQVVNVGMMLEESAINLARLTEGLGCLMVAYADPDAATIAGDFRGTDALVRALAPIAEGSCTPCP
ncbi:MAG: hypothetical protein KGL39_25580 [Patescibacteria group bacterium]|nr:hypothetical protein [Patescibacteria group bacterium]